MQKNLPHIELPSNFTVSIVTVSLTDTPIQVGGSGEADTEQPLSRTVWVEKKRKSKKLLPWNSKRRWKLPIRRPKLRTTTATNKTLPIKTQRISYRSLARIRNLTESNLIPLEYTNSSAVSKYL